MVECCFHLWEKETHANEVNMNRDLMFPAVHLLSQGTTFFFFFIFSDYYTNTARSLAYSSAGHLH